MAETNQMIEMMRQLMEQNNNKLESLLDNKVERALEQNKKYYNELKSDVAIVISENEKIKDRVVTLEQKETSVEKKIDHALVELREEIDRIQSNINDASFRENSFVNHYNNQTGIEKSFVMENNLMKDVTIKAYNGSSRSGVHPIEFLNSVKEKLVRSNIQNGADQVFYASQFLEGRAASLYTVEKDSITNFDEFERFIIDSFWSTGIQNRVRDEIFARRQYNSNNGEMLDHFINWVKKAKYLTPPIEEAYLVNTIMRHYGQIVYMQFCNFKINKIKDAIKFLQNLDDNNFSDFRFSNRLGTGPMYERNSTFRTNYNHQNHDNRNYNYRQDTRNQFDNNNNRFRNGERENNQSKN